MIVAESSPQKQGECHFLSLSPAPSVVPEIQWGRGAGGGAELNSKSKVYLENRKAVCLKLMEQEKDSKLKMLPGVRLWPTLMAR